MVKWLVGVLTVLAVTASAGANRYDQAPVLPKGLNAEPFSSPYAQQQPQQDAPIQQNYQPYAPQQPIQQAPPLPQPQQPVYQPAPQQQPPAPQPQQPYEQQPAPQQQPPVQQPQPQGPYQQPPPQQQPPAPQQSYGAPQQPQADQPLYYAAHHEQPQPQQSYGPAPQQPYGQKVQQTPPKPNYDCSVKTDGDYTLKRCHNQYIRCIYGEPVLVECPANLVFAGDRCEYKNECMNPTPPTPPPQQQPPSGYGRQINPYGQQQVQQTPPAPVETYCQDHNLFEGYHGEACSNHYFSCSPSVTTRVKCPQGLFYDNESKNCDYKQHIVACGGRRPTLPPAQTQPISPYGQQQQPAQQAYGPAPPAPQPQQSYGQPQQQPPVPQPQQPYGQPQPQQQQPLQQTYEAPQQQMPQQPYGQPAPQRQPSAPQPSYGQQPAPQNPYAPVQQQTPPKPVDTFCQNRDDGFHGKKCASYFYVCALGQSTKLDCPAGLFYDQETRECGHRDEIVSCGGRKPTSPPAQQPPQSQGPYGQRLPARQPPPRPEFDCSNRKDGIYVRGCNAKYFICLLGTSTALSCPVGTFYSAFTEECDYKANVVECGGIAPTKPPVFQNPIQLPQQPYGQAPQQQPPVSQGSYGKSQPAQQELSQPNNPCAMLSNGIYGRKCSRFFFVCATKKTYDFMCPKDHAFNLKTVKCAPKVEIDVCPEFGEIESIIQESPPAPIEIQSQTPYGQPQQPAQQPPAPQPQPQQSYGAPVQQQPPLIQPQPQPYGQLVQQQPPAPQPQPQQQVYQPAPQRQPPAPQPQPQGPYQQLAPQQQPPVPQPQQSYGAPQQPQAPQQQPPAPQPQQSYGQQPAPQQQPPAPQPQQTYQAPPIQQQQPQAPPQQGYSNQRYL